MQQLILSWNNREEIYEHPVPLQEWSMEHPHNTYSFTTMTTGDAQAIGAKKLRHIVISSFFASDPDYTFLYSKDFPDPWDVVNVIENWKAKNRPIRVIIADTPINLAMSIDSFSYGKGDNSDDVSFSLELTEYRFLSVPRTERPQEELNERADENPEPKAYKAKQNESLIDIAEKELGDGARWTEIAELNGYYIEGLTEELVTESPRELKLPPKNVYVAKQSEEFKEIAKVTLGNEEYWKEIARMNNYYIEGLTEELVTESPRELIIPKNPPPLNTEDQK